jgi:hypothetical protein
MRRSAGVVDPQRSRIARENRAKWPGHTDAGLQRLREAALRYKPWLYSTGPRTELGKQICANNGRRSKRDIYSFPEVRAAIRAANFQIRELVKLRERVMSRGGPDAGTP